MAIDLIARGLAGKADSKAVTAYEYAQRAGYTGTEEEFAEDMGNSATNATNARESAEQAQEYAEQAEQTLENKADIDGYYEDLTAGSAEQLLSSVYVEDNTPYSFRTSGGNLEIGNREEQRKIIGVSVVQNQLINPNSSQSSGTTDGVTVTNNKDGSYTLTGTKTTNANTYYYLMYSLPVGSKYVICGANTANAGGGGASGGYNLFCAYLNAGTSFAKQQGSQPLIINPSDTTKEGWRLQLQIGYANGAINTYNDTIRPMVINLTQRFGAEFADWLYSLTRAKYTEILYQLIPELNGGFIPFNTGVMGSVNVSKHRMTQYNLLDEDTVLPSLGFTKQSDGSFYAMPQIVYDKVIFTNRKLQYSGQYHIHFMYRYASASAGFRIKINYTDGTSTRGLITNLSTTFAEYNITSTSGKTVKNIVTDYGSSVGSYIKDFCISFYYDGERAGEYEPFKLHEYDYDSSVELRGLLRVDSNGNIYADGDEYKADGSVKRKWGITNLGTAITSWDYQQRGGYGRFGAIQKLAGASTSGGTDINILCGKYAPNASLVSANAVNKAICLYNGSVYIRDDNYTTSAQLVTALQNVWIIYPLATITEETANPYTETQVVDNWGTEEFVDAQGRSIVLPVGHVTDYPQDLKAKLETAPNAPSENGDYLVRQSNSGTEYVPYTGDARIDNLEENKADKNGTYKGMIVGLADNLNANTKIPLTKPYVLRSTAESEDVAGLYKRKHLTGGSLVWNQLIQNGNFANALNWYTNKGTIAVANNKCTFTLGSNVGTASSLYQPLTGKFFSGHVYFVAATLTSSANTTAQLRLFGSNGYSEALTANNRKQITAFFKPNGNDSNLYVYVNIGGALVENDSVILENIMCLDLTTTFGTTFANAIYSMNDHGLAWLYANFPELNGGYIPYSAPHFEHSKYKGVTSNGVNQFNGQTAEGYYDTTTGAFVSENRYICNDDLFVCLPNATYYLKFKANASLYVLFYDINKNFISPYSVVTGNTTFTTPSNAYYMVWWQSKANYGSETYQNDVAFYIHYDSSYDDIYEDYESWYTDLGSDVLKGMPVADDWTGTGTWSGEWHWEGDTKTPDGVITVNMSEEDAGSVNWSYVPDLTLLTLSIAFASEDTPNNKVGKVSAIGYETVSRDDLLTGDTKKICVNNVGTLIIYNPDFANKTREERIALITGTPILYKKHTPTTSQGTAYEENEQCHNWGIQYVEDAEYDDGNRAFKMPMGGEEVYTPNLTEKVEAMPSAPVADGDYIVRVVNNKAEYIPLPNSFPTTPSTDGTFALKCTVSGGTPTLEWVAE